MGFDLRDIGAAVRVALPARVVARANDRTVGFETDRMERACGDRDDVRPFRYIALSVGVVACGKDGPVRAERRRMRIADCQDAGRHLFAYAFQFIFPGSLRRVERAELFQHECVVPIRVQIGIEPALRGDHFIGQRLVLAPKLQEKR